MLITFFAMYHIILLALDVACFHIDNIF